MLKSVNLHEELIRNRKKELHKLTVSAWVEQVFKEVDNKHDRIRENLGATGNKGLSMLDFDKLEPENIFHISQIRKICIDYRLKFLDTELFKGDYPSEAISKIRHIEDIHDTELKDFKIIAPSILFKLNKADDPLLFTPLGNDYFYFIHKWGNDVNLSRRIKYWSIKNIENFIITLLSVSILLTIITHQFFFREQASIVYFLVLFMFYFKGAVGMALFYGISIGKNFSEYAWKSKYDKIT